MATPNRTLLNQAGRRRADGIGGLLDEREKTSCPDAVRAANGSIHAIYGRARYGNKVSLRAVFRQEDEGAGRWHSPDARGLRPSLPLCTFTVDSALGNRMLKGESAE